MISTYKFELADLNVLLKSVLRSKREVIFEKVI